jgi:plasmid stabilization system protein ParE
VILLSSEAISDLRRIRDFLASNNPAAAMRAMDRIWSALGRVEQMPHMGKPTNDLKIRQIVVPFGSGAYVVRYLFDDVEDAVLVTRLWHSREKRD